MLITGRPMPRKTQAGKHRIKQDFLWWQFEDWSAEGDCEFAIMEGFLEEGRRLNSSP